MRHLCIAIGLMAAAASPAFAQNGPPAAHEGAASAPSELVEIPEDQRGRAIAVQAGAHMEVRLDEQMRIASILPSAPPGEADFDPSQLSRTEETLVSLGRVTMWAAPGAIGFTVILTGDQTNLKVSNNTGGPVAYIAALYRGDPLDRKYEFTTTCTVGAGKAVVESWPYLVEGVVIVQILAPPESDLVLCVDPTKSYKNPTWYPLELQ